VHRKGLRQDFSCEREKNLRGKKREGKVCPRRGEGPTGRRSKLKRGSCARNGAVVRIVGRGGKNSLAGKVWTRGRTWLLLKTKGGIAGWDAVRWCREED